MLSTRHVAMEHASATVTTSATVSNAPKVGCNDPQCACESPFWDDPQRTCDFCHRVTETVRVRINQAGGPALCDRCY